jgi:hypothetical protein
MGGIKFIVVRCHSPVDEDIRRARTATTNQPTHSRPTSSLSLLFLASVFTTSNQVDSSITQWRQRYIPQPDQQLCALTSPLPHPASPNTLTPCPTTRVLPNRRRTSSLKLTVCRFGSQQQLIPAAECRPPVARVANFPQTILLTSRLSARTATKSSSRSRRPQS